jgi:hypothetical protein
LYDDKNLFSFNILYEFHCIYLTRSYQHSQTTSLAEARQQQLAEARAMVVPVKILIVFSVGLTKPNKL